MTRTCACAASGVTLPGGYPEPQQLYHSDPTRLESGRACCFNERTEDVTSFVARYREAARHIWNCLLREEALDDPALHDWEGLKQVLFTAQVLRNCGHDECAAAPLAPDRYGVSWIKPIVHLHVVPLAARVRNLVFEFACD